jgi:hypothetical protein
MAVVRETVVAPRSSGKTRTLKASRQANGMWYVEFDLDFKVALGDGRSVRVRRTVSLLAEPQVGRKPRVLREHPVE